MNNYRGSPAKLRSGEWGCRITGGPSAVKKGQVVTVDVTTKAGKSWTGDYRVIAVFSDAALAAKVDGNGGGARRSNSSSYSTSRCRSCGGPQDADLVARGICDQPCE